MKIIFVLLLVALIVGCSSTPKDNSLALAQIQQPTFKMECPESGCNFSSFEYNDPNRKIATQSNGYDVANKAIGAVSNVLLGVAPYYAITEGFRYMNGTSNVDNSSVDQSNNAVTDNSVRDNSSRTIIEGGE